MNRDALRNQLWKYADKNVAQYEATLAHVQELGESGIRPGQLERDREIVKTGFIMSGATASSADALLNATEQYVPLDSEFNHHLLDHGVLRERLRACMPIKGWYFQERDKGAVLTALHRVGFVPDDQGESVIAILDRINVIEAEFRQAMENVVSEILDAQVPDAKR